MYAVYSKIESVRTLNGNYVVTSDEKLYGIYCSYKESEKAKGDSLKELEKRMLERMDEETTGYAAVFIKILWDSINEDNISGNGFVGKVICRTAQDRKEDNNKEESCPKLTQKYTRDYILRNTNIVTVIKELVEYKDKFNYEYEDHHIICCPFHDEQTPSFVMNNTKKSYHCFGCGVSGDVIDFVKMKYDVNEEQAIEMLIDRFR